LRGLTANIGCRFPCRSIVVMVELRIPGFHLPDHLKEHPMTKTIFISLPVTDLAASTAFYQALGFERNPKMSDDTGACMRWSESIQVMLITHAKWRTFTQRPFPPAGTSGLMLSLTLDSREAVDAMNRAASANGGQADANPPEDYGFMYTRDIADPDGHLWAALWMDPAEPGEG
jgi:predicted lactoylglutathione lyase